MFLRLTAMAILFLFLQTLGIEICIRKSINNSNRKKIKQNQNLMQRIFYVKFRDVVPKTLLFSYYLNFIAYLTLILIDIFGVLPEKTISYCADIIFVVEIIPLLMVRIKYNGK